ncbi:hypothetical protein HDU97_001511 [Phlyctochytrium planicorne]|nr:hypothetical protein HDU97_001511 [Phlyctochytrium planicorne]
MPQHSPSWRSQSPIGSPYRLEKRVSFADMTSTRTPHSDRLRASYWDDDDISTSDLHKLELYPGRILDVVLLNKTTVLSKTRFLKFEQELKDVDAMYTILEDPKGSYGLTKQTIQKLQIYHVFEMVLGGGCWDIFGVPFEEDVDRSQPLELGIATFENAVWDRETRRYKRILIEFLTQLFIAYLELNGGKIPHITNELFDHQRIDCDFMDEQWFKRAMLDRKMELIQLAETEESLISRFPYHDFAETVRNYLVDVLAAVVSPPRSSERRVKFSPDTSPARAPIYVAETIMTPPRTPVPQRRPLPTRESREDSEEREDIFYDFEPNEFDQTFDSYMERTPEPTPSRATSGITRNVSPQSRNRNDDEDIPALVPSSTPPRPRQRSVLSEISDPSSPDLRQRSTATPTARVTIARPESISTPPRRRRSPRRRENTPDSDTNVLVTIGDDDEDNDDMQIDPEDVEAVAVQSKVTLQEKRRAAELRRPRRKLKPRRRPLKQRWEKWSEDELRALEEGIRSFQSRWSLIEMHFGDRMPGRDQVDMKDKARNEMLRRQRRGEPLGIWGVQVKKRAPRRKYDTPTTIQAFEERRPL